MRLSQIARKLGVTQSTITDLLVEKGYDAPKGGNAKLNEEEVTTLYKHFDITVFTEPEVIKQLEVEAEENTENEKAIDTTDSETTIEEKQEVELVADPEADEDKKDEAPAVLEEEEEVEVIRAKKVKLDGIKVVGKIELPEPKPKPEPESKVEEEEKEKIERPRGRRKYNDRNKRRKKTPLSFEQKQAIEEKKARREKAEREKKLREKKKKYFEQNIKPKQKEVAEAVQKKKKKKIEAAQKETSTKRTKITTKNPIKRLWQWFNDPYA